MSGCEICWERAQQDAHLLGGSVVDHYRKRLDEIDEDEAQRDMPPSRAEAGVARNSRVIAGEHGRHADA